MAKSKEKEIGLINSNVYDTVRVIDNVKLYFASGETDTTNRSVLEFFVGSDGNLYSSADIYNDNKLVRLR